MINLHVKKVYSSVKSKKMSTGTAKKVSLRIKSVTNQNSKPNKFNE